MALRKREIAGRKREVACENEIWLTKTRNVLGQREIAWENEKWLGENEN